MAALYAVPCIFGVASIYTWGRDPYLLIFLTAYEGDSVTVVLVKVKNALGQRHQ